MRIKFVGNKAETGIAVIKNAETSATIYRGQPVVLVMNGTDDGLAVVLPSTAGNAKTGIFPFGVAMGDIAAGQIGESMLFGVCPFARINRNTRSATDANYTTVAAVTLGEILVIDTANNAFAVAGTVAATRNPYLAAAGESVASAATLASSTSNTALTLTAGAKIYVRML